MYFSDTRNEFLDRGELAIASEAEVLDSREAKISTNFSSYIDQVSVLDVACCDGRWSSWFLDNGANTVHAFDIEENYVSNAPTLMANYHDESLYSFETSSWEDFSTVESFDVVALFGILHFIDPADVATLLEKATTLGDTIIIDTPINDDVTADSISSVLNGLNYTTTELEYDEENLRSYIVSTKNI